MQRPQNAFENAMLAADMIATHPTNYIQDVYNISLLPADAAWRDDILTETVRDITPVEKVEEALQSPDNECGTAYCRAGWMVLLAMGMPDERGLLRVDKNIGWSSTSNTLVGKTLFDDEWDDEGEEAFARDWNKVVDMTSNPYIYGETEYHLEGARGLRAFAYKWRERLERTVYDYNADGTFAGVRLAPKQS